MVGSDTNFARQARRAGTCRLTHGVVESYADEAPLVEVGERLLSLLGPEMPEDEMVRSNDLPVEFSEEAACDDTYEEEDGGGASYDDQQQ